MIALGKEKHSGNFAAWWKRALYRLLHADISYISLPTSNRGLEDVYHEIKTSISDAREKPHRAVVFHFDEVMSGEIFRAIWMYMVEIRIEFAQSESPSDVLVEFLFTGRQTLFNQVGSKKMGSPTPVHWILFHPLQEIDVDEVIRRVSAIDNALLHLTNRSDNLRKTFIREFALSCGGIPRLIQFSLGTMAALVNNMDDLLKLSTEEEVRIFVHEVLYEYYARTSESSRVQISNGLALVEDNTRAEQRPINNDDMLLIIAQLFSRREEIATKRQDERISFALKSGQSITLSVADLMVRAPLYFSLGHDASPTQAISLHVVQSSFVVRAMLINAPDLYIASRIELATSTSPSRGLRSHSDLGNALEIAFATTVHLRLLTSPYASVVQVISGLDINSRHVVTYGNATHAYDTLSLPLSCDASVYRFSERIIHLPKVTTGTNKQSRRDLPTSDANFGKLLHYFGETATLHPADTKLIYARMSHAVKRENKHIVLTHRPKSGSGDVVAFLSTKRNAIALSLLLMMQRKSGLQENTIADFAKELKKMQRLHDVCDTNPAVYLFGSTSLNEAFGALVPTGGLLVFGPATYTIKGSKLACNGKIVNKEHNLKVPPGFRFTIRKGQVSVVMHPARLRDYLAELGNIFMAT